MLPEKPLKEADKWSSDCDTFIVLGSSLAVSPANYFPRQAKDSGSKLVIINRDKTPLDYLADLVVNESIGSYLTEVNKSLKLL
jgi:NAD-dependent deacetylase